MVLTNPDLKAIQSIGFAKYIYNKPDPVLIRKWKEGISRSVFYPQYHGFSHSNFNWWAKDLISKNTFALELLNLGIVRLPSFTAGGYDYTYEGEYVDLSVFPSRAVPLEIQRDMIAKGVSVFHEIFGFKPVSTVAPFYVWDQKIQKCAGIRKA